MMRRPKLAHSTQTESAGSGVRQVLITCVSKIWRTLVNLFSCTPGGCVGLSVEETEPVEPQSSVQPFICSCSRYSKTATV
ncbi:hypothetical protein SRHO_G00143830 [Serrasalmus rhombeus]